MKKNTSKKYINNYIKLVVLRIDFNRIESFNIKDFDKLKVFKKYPIEKTEQRIDVSVDISKDKQVSNKIAEHNEYRYYDSSMKNCVCLSNNSIFFEIKNHFAYEELEKQFFELFDKLVKSYDINLINRIGLRYVNEIDDFEEEFFEKNLLSAESFIKTVAQANNEFEENLLLGQIGFKNNETITNFTYGKPNKNHPAKQVDKVFVLDYDSFARNIDEDNLKAVLIKLHKNINDLFELSITNKLRKKMNSK